MIKHKTLSLPHYVYPVDEWKIIETRFYPRFLAGAETIFSTSNGYLGIRGAFEEDAPVHQSGTFVNGFYESWPIVYGEEAYGFAKTGQTMVNVPDSTLIRLYVDDEPFHLPSATLLHFERTLDMQAGVLGREILWETSTGKQVLIKSRRLVSFQHRHLAAISYQVTVLNAEARVSFFSEIVYNHTRQTNGGDPRKARGFKARPLCPQLDYVREQRAILSYATQNSKMTLACGIDHTLETAHPYSVDSESAGDSGKVVFCTEAYPEEPIILTKYMTYYTAWTAKIDELCTQAERTLDRAKGQGFPNLLASQRQYLDEFWLRSDVQVGGDPMVQQDIRFNLFQLCQATARAEGAGVPAKGLTGQAYEGQYFWDAEIYMLPFLIYTAPQIAKNLLKFRYSLLDKARMRAQEVGHKGALFPWRTINGEEASACYAAGTAQYHINADIMYALRKYVDATKDEAFLYDKGAEMLVETARMWSDLGFYSERREGQFCIHGVTGPDEYTTVVNNNTFTNLMARENLRYAAEAVETLRKENPQAFVALLDKTGLGPAEVEEWKATAERMYIPFDQERGIHPQDDNFLDREVWDFASTPADKYPLLLHYHPLMIYRHQVLKQADVVLAMFLLGREFSREQKQRNFDYYDPLTTGDSSLSACIQSIVAAEIGYAEKAYEYFRYAALMDLADVRGNVQDGVHIASMGGTWMALVYGFGGMRDDEGLLRFDPRLPERWDRLKFPLTIQGRVLDVEIEKTSVTYLLRKGSDLVISHQGEAVQLSEGKPISVRLRAGADTTWSRREGPQSETDLCVFVSPQPESRKGYTPGAKERDLGSAYDNRSLPFLYEGSDLPRNGKAEIGRVGTVEPRLDRLGEVMPERGMTSHDPFESGSNRACYIYPRPLRR